MKISIIDTETTGLDPAADGVMELGWTFVTESGIEGPYASFVNPGDRVCSPQARAAHHIMDENVESAPPIADVLPRALEGVDVVAMHKADFDLGFLQLSGVPVICTLRCAQHLWPDAPAFNNHTLRYWRGLCLRDPRAMPPHRAGPDTFVTAHILLELLQERSAEDLIQLTTAPVLLKTVRFGKHAGTLWEKVPGDYLRWLVDRSGMDDRDVIHTARHWLSRTRAA